MPAIVRSIVQGARRRFLIRAGILLAISTMARAQQGKKFRIGLLTASSLVPERSLILEGLRKLGYVEGTNIEVDARTAGGAPHLLPGIAADLVRRDVDIIVTVATPPSLAARDATRRIPIVMASVGDPVASGLVASLARPGGNVTGLSSANTETANKLCDYIREVLPHAKSVGVLANPGDPFAKIFLREIGAAARSQSIEVLQIMIGDAKAYGAAFAELRKRGAHAVIVQPTLPRREAVKEALQSALPLFSTSLIFASEGGLLSYAASYKDTFYAAAVYVDKILKGARPAELPVQRPTHFELVINLKTAKALGLTLPQSLVLRADSLIE